jgi:hypothetical protein
MAELAKAWGTRRAVIAPSSRPSHTPSNAHMVRSVSAVGTVGCVEPDGRRKDVPMKIEALFELYSDEFLDFDAVEHKLSYRPDLHAFLLLDSLLPGTHDMIAGAEHGEIFLDVSSEGLFRVATKEQIRDLVRCGVRYDYGTESLCMFV